MLAEKVPGWMHRKYGLKLAELAGQVQPPNVIVQVGVTYGRAAFFMAEANRAVSVVGVDPWDLKGDRASDIGPGTGAGYPPGRFDLTDPEIRKQATVWRDQLGLGNVKWVRGFSVPTAEKWKRGPVGMLMLDGDHDYPAPLEDARAWEPHLAADATVVFDDYDAALFPGVVQAVTELAREWGEPEIYGRLAIFRRRPARAAGPISVAVMAHPKRADLVEELVGRLDTDATVVWDESQDRIDTGRRSLAAYDPDAEWHMVIQDDAVVCRDLVAGLGKALVHVPEGHPVGLYFGRVRPFAAQAAAAAAEAERRDASWIVTHGPIWGVGFVFPTATIPALLAAYDADDSPDYDMRVRRFYDKARLPCWNSWPSLVDHRTDVASLAHNTEDRVAHRFLGVDASALDVTWTDTNITMKR